MSIKGHNAVLFVVIYPSAIPRHYFSISTLIPNLKKIGKKTPKIESENKFLTSIKVYNSVLICQNSPICNPRTFFHNIYSHTKFESLKKIGKGMPKIESENKFLTSIKGCNSVLICQNLPICNPRILLPYINSHGKFEENWLINAPSRE